MKTIFALIAIMTVFSAPSSANAVQSSALVPIDNIYVPKGFDSNDHAQVVITGYLPNLCYKAPKVLSEVKGRAISITVSATVTQGVPCIEAVVPFLEVVSVGAIQPGDYNIVANGESRFQKQAMIEISRAPTPETDNYIYANVDYVESTQGNRTVTLKGYNPSSCFEFERFEFISNGKDTYSILPIMKQVQEICPMKLVPFSIEMDVPDALSMEKILLHVRVMNGKSVNTIFKNE